MNSEVIIEEGIVVSIENGFANVSVSQSDSCDECSAKIICRPKQSDERIVKVIDLFGVKPGDKVHFEVKGKDLLNASFSLYGVPLILFVVGILLGMSLFSQFRAKELFSFLFAAALVALYFFLSMLNVKKEKKEVIPKIISVCK